jgi:thiol-disulfide isomerase/thioredoxin
MERAPSRGRRWRRIFLEAAVVAAALTAVGSWRTRDHRRGAVPALSLPSVDGPPLALAALAGKPTLLVFFAPWCGVCKANAQNVRWVEAAVGEGARVISIASSYQSDAEVGAYLAEHPMPRPVLLDDRGAAAAFGVAAFPAFFFLDRTGQITGSTVGYTTTLGLLARLWL